MNADDNGQQETKREEFRERQSMLPNAVRDPDESKRGKRGADNITLIGEQKGISYEECGRDPKQSNWKQSSRGETEPDESTYPARKRREVCCRTTDPATPLFEVRLERRRGLIVDDGIDDFER